MAVSRRFPRRFRPQRVQESANPRASEGKRITVDELAVHLSAIDLRLRQLARAAESPDTPVELEPTIDSLRATARGVAETGERMAHLARIVAGDVPLAYTFCSGDPWGAAALDTDREDYGGPAVIPTHAQLVRLAGDGDIKAGVGKETTTWPEGMKDVPRSVMLSWESKAVLGALGAFSTRLSVGVGIVICARPRTGPSQPQSMTGAF